MERGPAVATVNGVPIYKSDFETALQNFLRSSGASENLPESDRQKARQAVLDGLIGTELLDQKAKGIPVEVPKAEIDAAVTRAKTGVPEADYQAELDRRGLTPADIEQMVEKNLRVQRMIEQNIVNNVVIPDAEIRKFYEDHPDDMRKPEDIEASHILVKSVASDPPDKRAAARKRIEEALKQVKGGTDFGQVARQFSEDGSASRGGALGPIIRGRTVPEFEQAAFGLKTGEVSGVVESPFGFHVIKVTARHESVPVKFDDAKQKIADFLKQRKSQEAIQQLVDSLRAEAKIEIL
ncbi:MAG TPA: peptidylprolyl isomerase [Candidatus Polarisedimenticolia bacterium]|nr:peptidylprolyl isomerase [Candidatus Polarisedimenticolia bacterium]